MLCAIKVILCIVKIRVFLYLCAIKVKYYGVHLPIIMIFLCGYNNETFRNHIRELCCVFVNSLCFTV